MEVIKHEQENERFTRLVKENGFNISSFAREIGEKVQTVQHWEKRGVSKNGLETVSEKLGVTIDYLIKGK